MTSRALVYAVRFRVVAKYLGELCLPLALATLLPLGVALAAGSWAAGGALAGVAAVGGLAGWWAVRLPEVEDIQTNEALTVVALAFLAAGALMVPPFMAYGLSPMDAFFEAVSGVTTTGLSTLREVDDAPWDLLLIRSWLQWLGGLGFVTLSVLLVSRSGRVAQRLDTEDEGSESLAAHTRTHGRRALVAYSTLTLGGVVLLLATGLPVLDAVVHALSSVSTGGFSTRDASLGALGFWPRAASALLFVVGALPLLLVHQALRGSWRPVLRDRQLPAFLILGLVTSGLVVLFTLDVPGSWGERIGDALFMGFSAQSTTGFSTVDPAGMSGAALAALMVAMIIGGCAGSTSGGFKIWRALAAVRLTRHRVVLTALPEHAVYEPSLHGERLTMEERSGVLILAVLFLLVVGLSWLAFLAGGHAPLPALFDVVSAAGTVGLSTGVAGADLSTGLKWILCLDMLMGRLEILALLVLLAPGTWFGRRRSSA